MVAAALIETSPDTAISDATCALGRRGGRPIGSFSSPLAAWLRLVIQQLKRENYSCRNVFYRISLAEEMVDGEDAFIVSAETADDVWLECLGDIRGRKVSWEYFRKLWQRT